MSTPEKQNTTAPLSKARSRREWKLEELERIVNRSPAIVFLWRAQEGWPVDFVSDNIAQFGYSPEDFYSGPVPYAGIVHPDDLARVGEEVSRYSAEPNRENFRQEYRLRTSDGAYRWVKDWTWIRRDPEGNITHFEGIVLDIHEQKNIENDLRKAHRRYENLVNNLNVGVYRNTPGPNGKFIEANPAIVQMFEAASRDEFMRHAVSDLYQHPEDRAHFSEKLDRQGYVRNEEIPFVTLKGRNFWGSITAVKVIDSDGSVYFDGIVEDVTMRRQVEEQLRVQSKALDAAANGIVITDPEGTIVWVNTAFTQLTGYTRDEAVGNNPRILKSDKQTKAYYHELWETIRAGRVWHGELTNRRKDGSEYVEEMTITPVKNQDGAIVSFIAIKQDVTERLEAEQELAAKAEQLRLRNMQMEDDLKMAQEIQQALLPHDYPCIPPSSAPEESALRFHHIYLPSGVVGGDFFDVLPLSESRAGIFLCDVMGHGMRSALVTAILRGLLEELTPIAHHPGTLLRELNKDFMAIFRRTNREIFVTAFYLVADISSGVMLYANAGHPGPFHIKRAGGLIESLGRNNELLGPALGLISEAVYPTTDTRLQEADRLLLYTDGVIEVENETRQPFGEEGLSRLIREHIDEPPQAMLQHILQALQDHGRGGRMDDDICMLSMDVAWLGKDPGYN